MMSQGGEGGAVAVARTFVSLFCGMEFAQVPYIDVEIKGW